MHGAECEAPRCLWTMHRHAIGLSPMVRCSFCIYFLHTHTDSRVENRKTDPRAVGQVGGGVSVFFSPRFFAPSLVAKTSRHIAKNMQQMFGRGKTKKKQRLATFLSVCKIGKACSLASFTANALIVNYEHLLPLLLLLGVVWQ